MGLSLYTGDGANDITGDIAGVVCIVLAVPFALVAVLGLRLWWGFRRAPKEPQRVLTIFTDGALPNAPRAMGVFGTIVSPPRLQGPLTWRRCVAWHLDLWRHDSEGDSQRWTKVWCGDHVQDLEIAYDVRFEHNGRQPLPTNQQFPAQPGTVEIRGDVISLRQSPLPRDIQEVALDPAALQRLVDWGLPEALRSEIAAEPYQYRLDEGCLDIGADVQCHQSGPNTRFMLARWNKEELSGGGIGCVVLVALFFCLLMLVIADGFINGFPPPVD